MTTRERWTTTVVLATTLACTACTPTPSAESVADRRVDIAAAEGVVLSFFRAIEGMDFEQVRSVVTDDFEIIEDVFLFDTDGFLGLIEPFRDMDASIEYELSDFRTEVAGSVAWTRWRNSAVMTVGDQETPFDWVETGVLVRTDDGWRIDRLHSAPVDPDAEPPGA